MSIVRMPFDDIASEIATATTVKDRRVIITPIMRGIALSDGLAPYHVQLFYSVVTAGFRIEKILILEPVERLEIIGRLYAHKPALDLHFPENELEALRLAELWWPCERVREMREEVETKLKQTGADLS